MSSSTNETRRPMNTCIDVDIIKKLARKDLIALIQKSPGEKVLIWDKALANPTNLIATPTDFKENGVVKMLPLEPRLALPSDASETVLFICRPLVNLMNDVASCVRNEEKQGRRKKFHIFFLPRSSQLCIKWLEDNSLMRSIQSIEELPLLLFPLDSDVLTMELDTAFKEFHIDNDPTSMHHVAKALVFLQKKYGTPNHVFGKGPAASYVYELMQCIRNESASVKPQMTNSKIENMILIDRQVDMLSPLVTQLTYEGLIDEFYGITNNQVKFSEQKLGGATKTMNLHSSEELYMELRDKNFSAIGVALRSKTHEIREIFDQKDKAHSMGEMKRLVQQLPAVNVLKASVSNHTSVAERLKSCTENEDFLSSLECEQELLNGMDTDKVNSHIEDLCSRKAPIKKILRLVIIQCITGGGLKPKLMQHYERLIIQNYGFEHVLTLQRLHAVKLLQDKSGIRYSVLRRALNLTVCDVSETKPEDFAYVHSIYAPLSIRLVQHRLKPSLWSSLKYSLPTLLPGPTVDASFETPFMPNSTSVGKRSVKSTLVVFIGGCTFAEISALRFLAQQEDDCEFLVLTTKIINGNTFLASLFDDPRESC